MTAARRLAAILDVDVSAISRLMGEDEAHTRQLPAAGRFFLSDQPDNFCAHRSSGKRTTLTRVNVLLDQLVRSKLLRA